MMVPPSSAGAPTMHVLLCRAGPKLPPGLLKVAGRFNAKLYVAQTEKHVRTLLRDYPVDLAMIGSGLSPEVRGAMVQAIGAMCPELCVYINGAVESGLSFPKFFNKMLSLHMPRH
jgi:hypothetical protein